ncbi:MAG: transglutaminase family protein [Oscillospiraceae bacterium]|nr:transglutaminase family protein [Oscillospiraceae bacterium]
MKRLSFHYHLKITMDAPVSRHHFTLRCVPGSDARQRIDCLQYFISPGDYLSRGRDQWGNILLYGRCGGQQFGFEANVCGLAEVGLSGGTPSENPERERVFSFATPLTEADGALRDFSESLSVRSGAPAEMETVMCRIHDALSYQPGMTTVRTTAAEAFSIGCGVCQDYAHIMLAVLRAHGIPSRYAAGMLLGEGKSHAWVEVLHEGLWTGYDPTNCLVVSDQHIKLSHGRDAQDCAINRGIFRGSAKQKTDISVIVTENEERRLC